MKRSSFPALLVFFACACPISLAQHGSFVGCAPGVCVSGVCASGGFEPEVSPLATSVTRGQLLFTRKWTRDEGMGPLHNATSCVACHSQGGVGGGGPANVNVDVVTIRKLPRKQLRDFHKPGVLHTMSTGPAYARQRFERLGIRSRKSVAPCEELPADSAEAKLFASKETRLRKKGPVVLVNVDGGRFEVSQRSAPPLFGLGEIDNIPANVLHETASRLTKQFPHVTGRVAGRYGWRGQTRSLREFVFAACENELGISTEDLADPKRDAEKLGEGWNLEGDLTAFIRALPRPTRALPRSLFDRNMVQNGETTFHSIGCTACHVPQLGSVEELYSDLLLHDMGATLADSAAAPPDRTQVVETQVFSSPYGGSSGAPATAPRSTRPDTSTQREWKTPPLWGVADSAPYLHDGRAATLEAAILMHGGEASNSVQAYKRLGNAGQGRVLAFLRTLVAPRPHALTSITP